MLKILMATSEASPFAKTGGLADVLGSLPGELQKQDADVRVIMPKYGTFPGKLRDIIVHNRYIYVKVGWRNLYCGIEQAQYNGVTYYFFNEPKKETPVINVNKENDLASEVKALRTDVDTILSWIQQYQDGKLPSDFSAERVQARKEQLEKAQTKVEVEITPEDIPF